jgi:hypothetical protein
MRRSEYVLGIRMGHNKQHQTNQQLSSSKKKSSTSECNSEKIGAKKTMWITEKSGCKTTQFYSIIVNNILVNNFDDLCLKERTHQQF